MILLLEICRHARSVKRGPVLKFKTGNSIGFASAKLGGWTVMGGTPLTLRGNARLSVWDRCRLLGGWMIYYSEETHCWAAAIKQPLSAKTILLWTVMTVLHKKGCTDGCTGFRWDGPDRLMKGEVEYISAHQCQESLQCRFTQCVIHIAKWQKRLGSLQATENTLY